MKVRIDNNRILIYYPGGYNYYCDFSNTEKAYEIMKKILIDKPDMTIIEKDVMYGKFKRF